MFRQELLLPRDEGGQQCRRAGFSPQLVDADGSGEGQAGRKVQAAREEQLLQHLPELNQAAFVEWQPAEPGNWTARPAGRNGMTDDREKDARLWNSTKEQLDGARPSVDMVRCLPGERRVGVDLTRTVEEDRAPFLQVSDTLPRRVGPDQRVHINKEKVVFGVWQLFQKGDVAGYEPQVVAPQPGSDHQSVICSRMVGNDQQGFVGRDVLDAAGADVGAPVGQGPLGGCSAPLAGAQR